MLAWLKSGGRQTIAQRFNAGQKAKRPQAPEGRKKGPSPQRGKNSAAPAGRASFR